MQSAWKSVFSKPCNHLEWINDPKSGTEITTCKKPLVRGQCQTGSVGSCEFTPRTRSSFGVSLRFPTTRFQNIKIVNLKTPYEDATVHRKSIKDTDVRSPIKLRISNWHSVHWTQNAKRKNKHKFREYVCKYQELTTPLRNMKMGEKCVFGLLDSHNFLFIKLLLSIAQPFESIASVEWQTKNWLNSFCTIQNKENENRCCCSSILSRCYCGNWCWLWLRTVAKWLWLWITAAKWLWLRIIATKWL